MHPLCASLVLYQVIVLGILRMLSSPLEAFDLLILQELGAGLIMN